MTALKEISLFTAVTVGTFTTLIGGGILIFRLIGLALGAQ